MRLSVNLALALQQLRSMTPAKGEPRLSPQEKLEKLTSLTKGGGKKAPQSFVEKLEKINEEGFELLCEFVVIWQKSKSPAPKFPSWIVERASVYLASEKYDKAIFSGLLRELSEGRISFRQPSRLWRRLE